MKWKIGSGNNEKKLRMASVSNETKVVFLSTSAYGHKRLITLHFENYYNLFVKKNALLFMSKTFK